MFTILFGKRDKKFWADWRLSKMLNAFLCLIGCFPVFHFFFFLWQTLSKAHLKLLWEQFAFGACWFCVSAGAHLCKRSRGAIFRLCCSFLELHHRAWGGWQHFLRPSAWESPSLDLFKSCLDTILSNVPKGTLPVPRGWNRWHVMVPPDLILSVVL